MGFIAVYVIGCKGFEWRVRGLDCHEYGLKCCYTRICNVCNPVRFLLWRSETAWTALLHVTVPVLQT